MGLGWGRASTRSGDKLSIQNFGDRKGEAAPRDLASGWRPIMVQPSMRILAAFFALVALVLCLGCARDPHLRAQSHLAKGESYLRQNKVNEAAIELRQAVQLDPSLAKGHFELAKIALAKGAVGAGYYELMQASKYDPNLKDAQLLAAELIVRSGDLSTGRDRAQAILKKWPGDETATLILAESDIGLREIDLARPLIAHVLQNNPKNARAVIDRAMIEFRERNFDAAQADLQRASELAPQDLTPVSALAGIFEQRGDYSKAEDILKKALQRQPDSIPAQFLLASFYIQQKRNSDAEPILKRVANLADKDPQQRGVLAQFYRMAGRTQDAEREYKRILAAHPEDRLNWLQLADLYYQGKRTAEAEAIVSKLLKENSKDDLALLARGTMELNDHQADLAILDLQEAQKRNPESALVYVRLAQAFGVKDQTEQAKGVLNEALRRFPNYVPALLLRGEIEVRAGQLDPGIQDLEQVVAKDPKLLQASILLSQARASKGELGVAETSLRELLQEAPDNVTRENIIATLAAIKLRQHRTKDVRDLAAALLKSEPHSTVALALEGASYAAENKPEQGLRVMQEQLRAEPWAGGYEVLGRFATKNGKLATAVEAFQKTLQLEPNFDRARADLADAYALQGNANLAIPIYESLENKHPKDVYSRLRLAQFYDARGDWQNAKSMYEKVLQLDPENIVVKNNLAYLYTEHQGNLDVALKLAQEAKEAAPSDPNIADTLGWIYVQKGSYEAAIAQLTECVGKLPANPDFRYHLGVAYFKSGRRQEAKSSLQAAVANAGFKYASQANEILAQINR
jgi:tetratricopeptide (TPR) repeat protein